MMQLPIIHETRFKELGFWQIEPGCWSFVDLTDTPAQVGAHYATKAELLANCEQYATEFGCDGATPKQRTAQTLVSRFNIGVLASTACACAIDHPGEWTSMLLALRNELTRQAKIIDGL